ncbi:amino acid adenylation protein [Vibrio phage vB_VpaS_1601]|nr:amino acid adenylation protein [Vibrio phage vB_VpaP_1601]
MALPDLSSVITPSMVKTQLGVDNTDITDERIKNSGLYDELLLDYFGWFPKVMDLLNDPSGTQEVTMQQIAIKAYGKYFLCYKLALSGRLSFFQKIGDGENADSRFNINWEEVLDDWKDEMAKAKSTALGIDTPLTPVTETTQGTAIFGISRPGFDNVRQ